MKPAPFRYHRAVSVADALQALASSPDAKVLAGGQSLLTLMNLRLARPEVLVDLGGLDELRRSFADLDRMVLGALLTHRDIESHPELAVRHPVLATMVSHIGHVGIRHRGTLGGTLAHADPAAELPAAMVLLGARIHVESAARGRRVIDAQEFFVAHFESALDPDELITWIEIPDAATDSAAGFVEYAPRHGDYALAGAGSLVQRRADRHLAVRAVLISVGERPELVCSTAGVPDSDLAADWRAWAEPLVAHLRPIADNPEYIRDLAAQALAEASRKGWRSMSQMAST